MIPRTKVSSRNNRIDARMNGQKLTQSAQDLHRMKPDKIPEWRRELAQKTPLQTRKPFTCWERKNRFLPVKCHWCVHYTPNQAPCPEIHDLRKTSSMFCLFYMDFVSFWCVSFYWFPFFSLSVLIYVLLACLFVWFLVVCGFLWVMNQHMPFHMDILGKFRPS